MNCIFCGKTIEGQGRKYCSHQCANKHRRILEREQFEERTVLSCGGGVDSTAMAVLICQGELEPPDYAVMVDTGYEKTLTMKYVREWIQPKLAEAGVTLNIIRTRDYNPDQRIINPDGFCNCPLFRASDKTGRGNRLSTCCNDGWKAKVIRKWLAENGVHRYQSIIGIAADEAHRQRKPTRALYTNRYPLVEMGLTREACIKLITDAGWPEPIHSSCIMCGLQSDGEFWHMKYNAPEDFKRACEIEDEIHQQQPDIFIHRSCKPLNVVFR